jgi:hypothetical protein
VSVPSKTASTTSEVQGTTEVNRRGRPDWLRGERWTAQDWALGVAIAVLVTILSVLWRTEIVPTDPWHYTGAALNFPTSTWAPLGYTRYGMILPQGPLVILFGDAQVTYYFWPVVSAGVLAGSLYLLGRRWWGITGGVLAVVLTVSNPIVFLNLSRGYPDVMSTALFCLALVLALLARDRLVDGRRFPLPSLLLVGFLLGWAFEARETSVLAWPVVLVVLWRRGSLLKVAAAIAAPIALWAAVDVGIGVFAYGDPLLKLHTFTRQDLSVTTNPADLAAQREFVGRPRPFYLTVIPKAISNPATPGGVWMLLLGAVGVLAALVGRRATRLMGFWFLCVFVLFVGIGGMFFPAHPAGRLDVQRYWIPFFPPAALAVAGVLRAVAAGLARVTNRRLPAPWLAAALSAVVAVGPLVTLANFAQSSVFAPNGAAALQDLRGYFARSQVRGATVWSDWETLRILPIYQRGAFGGDKEWSAHFKSLTSKGKPKAGDYVVMYSTDGQTCFFCGQALRPWLKENTPLPSAWRPTYTAPSQNLTVYRVG